MMQLLLHRIHKTNKNKGFTLAELLVVVAIVGILVAISVPLFTAQLGKARKATNQANMRAAKIAATAQYLVNAKDGNQFYFKYNIDDGTLDSQSIDKPATDKYEVKDVESATSDRVYTSIIVGVRIDKTDIETTPTLVEIFVNK